MRAGDPGAGLRRGLPMVGSRDPEALDLEKARLREIDARPGRWRRWRGYWSLSGPGWVQSALTLGAGSAGSSIFAGAVYGYDLLWVQPVAMFLGVVMFSAIGHQTLVTQARPYDVFRKTLHPGPGLRLGRRGPDRLHHLAVPPIRAGHERQPGHLRRRGPRHAAGAHRPGPPRRGHGALLELRAGQPAGRAALRARSQISRPADGRSSSSSSSSRPASISGPSSRGSSASTSPATARA